MKSLPLYLALILLALASALAAAPAQPKATTPPPTATPQLAFLAGLATSAPPAFLATQVPLPQPAITCPACRTLCKQSCVGTGCACMPVCSPPGECECNMICP